MNTVTVSTTLWIAIVCMVIGFVTGGFIGFFNKDKRKIKDSEPAAPASEQPAPLADPAKYTELLRLWREKDGTRLFVETSGHLLGSSAPLNKNQKSRFIELIKELAVWTGIELSDLAPVKSNPVETSKVGGTVETAELEMTIPLAQLKGSEPVKTNPIPVVVPIPLASDSPPPAVQSPAQVPPPAPAYTIPAPIPVPPVVQATANGAAEKPKKQPTSMVEQIDEILQEIIKHSDDPTRHIKLMEERNEGVVVWVGQERFIGIDTVTDKSAIEMIRAAVKEWDRRTEIRPNAAS
jgi:hypothetical protein